MPKYFDNFIFVYNFDFLKTKKINCTLDFCITDIYLKAAHNFILNAKKNKYK